MKIMDHLMYQREVKIDSAKRHTKLAKRQRPDFVHKIIVAFGQSKLRKFQAGERSQTEDAEVENSKPGGWWF
ncbi:hypothetical protein C5167_011522 [Papaver somniferum]|uniref:Uncharacterized protein n=1 Tax=Papaver somniferum TaxID=3469 RepID=A0A4Y7K764_PAPSO|nr:hypothetical protein C5167_011522 [Papaver somniferum]